MPRTNGENPYQSPQSNDLSSPAAPPSTAHYRTSPAPISTMPPGIPYIVGNEAAERFSYYGMKAILFVFMTDHLRNHSGELEVMTKEVATFWYHLFNSTVYFFPVVGALVSDILWGKYRTILILSLVYCLGHLALAIDETRWGLAIGCGLISLGAGGIKPCVSAHVGDQFGQQNEHLISKVFGWFYFAINVGATVSMLLTPKLLEWYGPQVAFGVPGILMLLATLVFWLGRYKFIHVPPGGKSFLREAFTPEGRTALLRLLSIYVFIAVFWSLYDQSGSAWVDQAKHMDRTWNVFGYSIEVTPSQIQAVNGMLILAYVPLFGYLVYPLLNRVFPLTPLRKISLGLFLMVGAFAISALIETWIVAGQVPDIGWQILAYVVLTAAEVMVSITALEFSYTQAPKQMKSFVMALYMLSVSAGNLFTAGVNQFIQNEDGSSKLAGASYYWFFAGVMLTAAVLFIGVAWTYRGRTYIQGDQPAE